MSVTSLAPDTRVPADGGAPAVTLVFVHGAWHGPWCWERWVAGTRQQGLATATVTLPGHDRPGSQRRIWARMGSYVEHVRAVVSAIDGPVVVVGHSMGGHVTQRLLEDPPDNVRGAALVASVPRRGTWGFMGRLLRHSPGTTLRSLLTADLYRVVESETRTRRWFFSAATPDDIVRACNARLQNESSLAAMSLLVRFTRPSAARLPVMVLAADGDAVFSVRSQRRLAKAFGTSLQLVPGGHDVMLDVTADGALHLVLDWVRQIIR